MEDGNAYQHALNAVRKLTVGERLHLISVISAELAQEAATSVPTIDAATTYEPVSSTPVDPFDSPLMIIDRGNDQRSTQTTANGIDVETGLPLLTLDSAAMRRLAIEYREPSGRQGLHRERQAKQEPGLGLVHDVSYNDLAATGWAIIVHAQDDAAVIKALMPLIEHRARQQQVTLPPISFHPGERCDDWFIRHVPKEPDYPSPWHPKRRVRLPVFMYQGGDDYSCATFLRQHGVMATTVEPARGIPFYLLIVGRPGPLDPSDRAFIPYNFQYDLDIFWGVGRLCFTDESGEHDFAAYTSYAEHVVRFEQRTLPPYQKHIVYFATRHLRDEATQASEEQLVRPLAVGNVTQGIVPPALRYGFTSDLLSDGQATREQLSRVFRGVSPGGKPALLFSATHGAGLRSTHPSLPAHQGGLICQDWGGTGPVRPEHWLAADSLPDDLDVEGLIAIMFACYSLGCPQNDQYATATGRVREIAPRAIVAALPQRLLANGALAVIGHVDRAWNYSFSDPESPVQSQTQGFDDLMRRLMSGGRVGFATDSFNLRQAAFSESLSKYVEKAIHFELYGFDQIGAIWKAYHDSRSYAVLGDPAVCLPFQSR